MALKKEAELGDNEVHTTLNYYLDPSKGGSSTFYPGTAGNYRRKFDQQSVQIRDVRGFEATLSIDKQGFEVHHHVCTEKDFEDDDQVKTVVYDEITELLKERAAATRVHPFSHIIRRQAWEAAFKAATGASDSDGVNLLVPARFVHIDQSYGGALKVLHDQIPDEAERLSQTRWGIINVWRPIHDPVSKDPLTVCDSRSVLESELVVVTAKLPPEGSSTYESVSAGGWFDTWALKASPRHKWYYASGMTPEEVLLIKIFDSKRDGRARRVPHSAFIDPKTEQGTHLRQSIEIRCLVFWENEDAE